MQRSVKYFMQGCGIQEGRDDKLTMLYVGLMLEEMSEALDAIPGDHALMVPTLEIASNHFKRGDPIIMGNANRKELLDACIDLAWVALGCAHAMGANVGGAIQAVTKANMSKLIDCPDCGGEGCLACTFSGKIALRDGNGKIMKPDGWTAPDMGPFLP